MENPFSKLSDTLLTALWFQHCECLTSLTNTLSIVSIRKLQDQKKAEDEMGKLIAKEMCKRNLFEHIPLASEMGWHSVIAECKEY